MKRISGPNCNNYIKPGELQEEHRILLTRSLAKFNEIATFGSKRAIEGARETVVRQLEDEFLTYSSLNESRNPLKGLETYVFIIPSPFFEDVGTRIALT
jgi:atlastin